VEASIPPITFGAFTSATTSCAKTEAGISNAINKSILMAFVFFSCFCLFNFTSAAPITILARMPITINNSAINTINVSANGLLQIDGDGGPSAKAG